MLTARGAAMRRGGFSLAELMVVVVLLGIVMGGLMQVITRQQRFYRGTREVIETRSSVRQGIDVLRSELRGVSSIGGDIFSGEMNETSIEFRSTSGSSMICSIAVPGGATFVIPPQGILAAGAELSTWRTPPQVGDEVFIYDNGADAATADDSWTPIRTVTSVTPLVGACAGSGYVAAGDAGRTGYRLTVAPALTLTIPAGTPVRLFRRVRYELYEATDRRWYLGFSECRPTCTALEPVSGPYLPRVTGQPSGLGLYYFDVDGNATTDRFRVARIDVAVRAESEQSIDVNGGGTRKNFRDTSRVAIGLRNRS